MAIKFNGKSYYEDDGRLKEWDDELYAPGLHDDNLYIQLQKEDVEKIKTKLNEMEADKPIKNTVRAVINETLSSKILLIDVKNKNVYEAGEIILNILGDNRSLLNVWEVNEDTNLITIKKTDIDKLHKILKEYHDGDLALVSFTGGYDKEAESLLFKLWTRTQCVYNSGIEKLLKFCGIKTGMKFIEGAISRFKKVIALTRKKLSTQVQRWELALMQNFPLSIKIQKSLLRIREWYEHWDGQVYVSVSGKDSLALLHLVRSIYPHVPAVYVNTGLEMPEIVHFITKLDNVIVLYPEMNHKEVLTRYGVPVGSKETSAKISKLRTQNLSVRYRNKLLHGDERGSFGKLAEKWKPLLTAPFKVSEQCCDIMKKKPIKKFEKKTGLHPFTGEMAEESQNREQVYLQNGCNAFNTKRPKSTPLGFWREQDVLQYIAENNVIYPKDYYGDIIEIDGKLTTTKEKRSGCAYCLFGIEREPYPNRIQKMSVTHPPLYNYCVNTLKLGEVMDYIGIDYSPCTALEAV